MRIRIATFVLGVWMLVTGVAVGSLANSPFPQWITGAVIMVAELVAVKRDPARWVSFLAGAWLIIQPFLFDVGGALAAFNSYTIGLTVMVLASYATRQATYEPPSTYNKEEYGGKAYEARA